MNQGIILGHHTSPYGIKVDSSKVEIIINFPSPKKEKDVRSFLGHSGYYRRFIKYFSKIVAPMFLFLTKDVDFEYSNKCQQKSTK